MPINQCHGYLFQSFDNAQHNAGLPGQLLLFTALAKQKDEGEMGWVRYVWIIMTADHTDFQFFKPKDLHLIPGGLKTLNGLIQEEPLDLFSEFE